MQQANRLLTLFVEQKIRKTMQPENLYKNELFKYCKNSIRFVTVYKDVKR